MEKKKTYKSNWGLGTFNSEFETLQVCWSIGEVVLSSLEEAKEYTCNHINCSCIYCDKILLAHNDQNDKKAEKIIKSINTDKEMETETKKKHDQEFDKELSEIKKQTAQDEINEITENLGNLTAREFRQY